jgi:hypothetical protein
MIGLNYLVFLVKLCYNKNMKEIKSINKISLAKIMALFYGLTGFFIALVVAISSMANIIMQRDFQGSVLLVTLFNFGAGLLLGIVTALLTAFVGWVIGFISAGLYNWFSRRAGGLRIEFADFASAEAEEEKIDDNIN